MKYKHILLLFFIGILLAIYGAIVKINHLGDYGDDLLMYSFFAEILAVVLLIWKILSNKTIKSTLSEFLNK